VPVNSWDTSLDVYDRILQKELVLLRANLKNIITGNYRSRPPVEQGNLNLKSDFNKLCMIDLDEKVSFKQAIDRLRALTHKDYRNAFYIDPETGRKVYLSIQLFPEEDS
jgi:methionyl-tRNA formyltransferase